MRYLKGSKDVRLVYSGCNDNEIVVMGFMDSDLDHRRSLTGYVFQVYRCTVSWKATL